MKSGPPVQIDRFLSRKDAYFEIPNFQRQYSWHQENCEVFLEDFEKAIEEGKSHYLGSVFLSPSGRDREIIVDGQQRITTLLLMLIAIHHWLKDYRPNDYLGERLRRDYLENDPRYEGEKGRIKLKGTTKDSEIFEQIYSQKVKPENLQSNLYRAYSFFVRYFQDKFTHNRDPRDYIDNLDKLEIILVELEEKDDLQKIFEGINATGVSLSEGDKIRNFALTLNDEKIRNQVIQYWEEIEDKLIDVQKSTDYIADFFRKFLITNLRQSIKEDEVYSEFKKFFKEQVENPKNSDKINRFYELLLGDMERYLCLKLNQISDKYHKLENQIFRIHYLSIEIVYPLLMYVLRCYHNGIINPKEAKGFFEVTESYLARRIIVNQRTTGLDKIFQSIAKNIENYHRDHPQYSRLKIYQSLLLSQRGNGVFPDESFIENRFLDNNRMKREYCNFVLSSWDDKKQPKESFILRQLYAGKSAYSIEHIMPQKLNDDWQRDLGDNYKEIHEKYCNTLPNLTLTGYNVEYSNSSFAKKLNHPNGYKNSNLLINNFVKNQTTWNEDVLKERIKWWLDAINQIWVSPKANFPVPKKQRQGILNIELSEATGEKEELNGAKAISIQFEECPKQSVRTWFELIKYFVSVVYDLDNSCAEKLNKNEAAKRYMKHVSEIPQSFKGVKIADTPYIVDGGARTGYKLYFMKNALLALNINKKVTIEYFYPPD